ncbi:hypothetical protein N0M98_29155 [Paenibacillus doosanensis]|uniref:hypothetical protein n=1 Tax=Paenibacillus doosanensis TaxID=1229154 RepID=UPI00217FD926|nr:hypothetical protein [Paenibacillus doosanensis]MCS7464175.1 hypothetical protein [Paenibacillus doosanensis]
MSKKILPVIAALALVASGSSVFAASPSGESVELTSEDVKFGKMLNFNDEDLKDAQAKQFVLETKQRHDKILDKYAKIKNDPDFEIIADNGNGLFAYTYSKSVKTAEDKDRFFKKVKSFKGQSQTVDAITKKYRFNSSNGYIETYFSDTVSDTDFGSPEKLTADGGGTIQWFAQTSGVSDWDALASIKDVFKIDYDSVQSTSSITVGGSVGTTTSGNGSVTAGSTVSTTTATITIDWPSKGPYHYYDKSYGTIQVSAPNITKYTHESTNVATVAGSNIASMASDYTSIW